MKNDFTLILNLKGTLRLVLLVALVASFSAGTLSSRAAAPVATVAITNNSGSEIRGLYLAHANSEDWGPDQLNGAVIAPGASYTLSYSWDQASVKVIAEDKDGCFLSTTVDATGNSSWTITNDSARNCGASN